MKTTGTFLGELHAYDGSILRIDIHTHIHTHTHTHTHGNTAVTLVAHARRVLIIFDEQDGPGLPLCMRTGERSCRFWLSSFGFEA